MRQTDVGREHGVRGVVVEIVADVREEGAAGGEPFYDVDGVGEVRMAGMRFVAERVEEKNVETAQMGR